MLRRWRETRALDRVRLWVPEEISRLHERAGQYVMIGASPIVLASLPGMEEVELLLGADAQAELGLIEGAEVAMSLPQGAGFPLELALGRDVLVFAVGTAIAAVRPLLQQIVRRRAEVGAVTFFAGARSWDHHPYLDEDVGLIRADIEVRRSIGKPWVQELFAQKVLPLENACAFVCGMQAMIDGTRETLVSHGLNPAHIATNF